MLALVQRVIIRLPDWTLHLFVALVLMILAGAFLRARGLLGSQAPRMLAAGLHSTPQSSAPARRASAPKAQQPDDSNVHSGAAPLVSTVDSSAAPGRAAPVDDLPRRPRPPGIPDEAQPYRRTPLFTESTVPKGLLRDHSTRPGVYGLLHVVTGSVRYTVTDERQPDVGSITLTPDTSAGLIEPTILHHVKPLSEDTTFFVEFNRAEPQKKAEA